MKKILTVLAITLVFSCNSTAQKKDMADNDSKKFEVTKTDAEWKAQLTPKQYYILRQNGTERPFSSDLNKNYKAGKYVCAACNTPLFESENKFDSGTGWPSFDRAVTGNTQLEAGGSDFQGHEEHCAVCGGHLGHVFNDGPRATTGKRHCIDGDALLFIPEKG
ncbi:MAG: peptide-methionine (R)-S-oxide reductase MsrB [Aquaticitalea sp.]